jgi:hypothetical protein
MLMGLAPPTALACTPLAAAGCASEQDAAYVCARAEPDSAGGAAAAPRSTHSGRDAAGVTLHRERPVPWRAPSGPAPSQAPPARA